MKGGIPIFENEIKLVCDSFQKCRVRAVVLNTNALLSLSDVGLGYVLGGETLGNRLSKMLPSPPAPHTVYKIASSFGLRYICLRIDKKNDLTLFIGPYLSELPSRAFILELGEENGVSPKRMRHFEEYYGGLTVLAENNPLFLLLDSLCESIWRSPAFSIVEINERRDISQAPVIESHTDGDEDIQVSMKTLEKRYEFENEMILAVSQGQIHKEKQLLAAFSDNAFEKRISDQLRNAKNYCVIMNTLLRKAAERGGVHPFYIDRMSSDFAAKIERMTSLNENSELMREMFRSYCRLVRRHSTGKFSLLVQKTVVIIESDLSADLSLTSLAKMQNVSAGYLSAVFKKETGTTLSQFIIEKRIAYARHLLETTGLQIQTVALHTGILDVQYFSKLFKKHTGMTPREYREQKTSVFEKHTNA